MINRSKDGSLTGLPDYFCPDPPQPPQDSILVPEPPHEKHAVSLPLIPLPPHKPHLVMAELDPPQLEQVPGMTYH